MEMDTPQGGKIDRTKFKTLPIMEKTGFVELKPYEGDLPSPAEWEGLEYVDWKSGGDSNFAILASANGEHDPRGFWEHGKPDKDGIWTDNIDKIPTIKKWVESVGSNYGRVRIIKLQPNSYEDTVRNLHPDDNNRLTEPGTGFVIRAWLHLTDNPDSYMIVREDKDDPSTEHRIPCAAGAQFIVDSERLHHAVWHNNEKYNEPRYALITSFESGPELDSWIQSQLP